MAHDTRGVLASPAMSLCELEDVGFSTSLWSKDGSGSRQGTA